MSRGFGKGKSFKKFSYTYESLSKLSGLSVAALRKRVQRGDFDPNNLISVLEFINNRLQPKLEEDHSTLIERIESLKKT